MMMMMKVCLCQFPSLSQLNHPWIPFKDVICSDTDQRMVHAVFLEKK